jgi:hypothetical protein
MIKTNKISTWLRDEKPHPQRSDFNITLKQTTPESHSSGINDGCPCEQFLSACGIFYILDYGKVKVPTYLRISLASGWHTTLGPYLNAISIHPRTTTHEILILHRTRSPKRKYIRRERVMPYGDGELIWRSNTSNGKIPVNIP